MSLSRWIVLVCFLAAISVAAQETTVGRLPIGNDYIFGFGTATTAIDLSSPATANGEVNSVAVTLGTTTTCAGSTFKVRFFRVSSAGFQLVAERGPFTITAVQGVQRFTVSPAVTLQRGDLAGIYINSNTCGVLGVIDATQSVLSFQGDFTGGLVQNPTYLPGVRLSIVASTSVPALVGVVPAIGAINGAAGSAFRTSFDLANVSYDPVQLKFVFHPNGQAAAPSDPTTTMTLDGGASVSPDLMQRLGATGVGSLDVYSDGVPPLINARVYNDTGNGTNGFNESLVLSSQALRDGDHGFLNVPADLTRFRLNLGIRSLGSANVVCNAYGPDGIVSGSFTSTYATSTLELKAASQFLSTGTITAGGTIRCSVSGTAVLFGTVTDNTTNDSAIVYAERR